MTIEEKIRDLIDDYIHQLDDIEEDLKEQRVNPYLSGKAGVYGKAIRDLQGILEADNEC